MHQVMLSTKYSMIRPYFEEYGIQCSICYGTVSHAKRMNQIYRRTKEMLVSSRKQTINKIVFNWSLNTSNTYQKCSLILYGPSPPPSCKEHGKFVLKYWISETNLGTQVKCSFAHRLVSVTNKIFSSP